MAVNEYEERFRPPAPALHEIFAAEGGPGQKRRRRRIWLAAAAAVLVTITYGVVSHNAAHHWISEQHRSTGAYAQRWVTTVSVEFGCFPGGNRARDTNWVRA